MQRAFSPAWSKTVSEARAAGAWVVAVDRPGYGASCSHPNRTYVDWALDVEQLVDYLRLRHYAVVGFSSGGPHALACAALNDRRRVVACGLVSSDAPYAQMSIQMIERMYGVSKVNLEDARARARRNAESMRTAYLSIASEEKQHLAIADLDTAIAQGVEGAASDSVLEASASWGFDLSTVAVPIRVWHGTADRDVPVEAGHYLADALSRSDAPVDSHFVEDETHTLIRRRWQDILTKVVGDALDHFHNMYTHNTYSK